MVLIPEKPFDIEAVCAALRHRHENRNRYASIVVVAEGATPATGEMTLTDGGVDAFGHVRLGGIGDALAKEIEDRTGYESRAVVLGHVQRGGTPTAFDRVLSTRFGIAAIDAVHAGAFGQMVALRAGEIVRVPLAEATGELKLVSQDLYEVAEVFFG
jgi:6-phosphofructokinase 1